MSLSLRPALLFLLAAGLLAGCEHRPPQPSRRAAAPLPEGGAPPPAPPRQLEASLFTATVKGRVTYNGDGPPWVEIGKVDKPHQRKGLPPEVRKAGWYCDQSADGVGVRYAVVFLRPAGGLAMPKLAEEQLLLFDSKGVPTIEMPSGQFEPRVLVLGPKQHLRFVNNSKPGRSHDANLSGPNTYAKCLPASQEYTYEVLDASDSQPYGVSCKCYSFMSGYVWKFKHPFAAVTNENGEFEIKNVPVPTNGKLEVMVWHETFDAPGFKKIKDIETKDGSTETLDIAIPK